MGDFVSYVERLFQSPLCSTDSEFQRMSVFFRK